MSPTTTEVHCVSEPDHAWGGHSGVAAGRRTTKNASQGSTAPEMERIQTRIPGLTDAVSEFGAGSLNGNPSWSCSCRTSSSADSNRHQCPFPGSSCRQVHPDSGLADPSCRVQHSRG